MRDLNEYYHALNHYVDCFTWRSVRLTKEWYAHRLAAEQDRNEHGPCLSYKYYDYEDIINKNLAPFKKYKE